MPDATTIQLDKALADLLKRIAPGKTYNDAIQVVIQSIVSKERLPQTKETPVLSFSKSIPAVTGDSQDRDVPFDSIVTSVIMFFPNGTSNLVDVRVLNLVGDNKVFLVPSRDESYISLNNVIVPFTINKFVPKNSRITVEWNNYDAVFQHTIPTMITLEKIP